jgi:hypothetical protein
VVAVKCKKADPDIFRLRISQDFIFRIKTHQEKEKKEKKKSGQKHPRGKEKS